MEEIYIDEEQRQLSHPQRRESGIFMRTLDGLFDFGATCLRTIGHEKELFLGVALTLIGLLSLESDKFCDGNTADYLSCTRPSTFYFYSPLDITIIVIGVFLIMIWALNRRNRS